jgi:hypothetical protein
MTEAMKRGREAVFYLDDESAVKCIDPIVHPMVAVRRVKTRPHNEMGISM